MLDKVMKKIDTTLIPKFNAKIDSATKSVVKDIKKELRAISSQIEDLKKEVRKK